MRSRLDKAPGVGTPGNAPRKAKFLNLFNLLPFASNGEGVYNFDVLWGDSEFLMEIERCPCVLLLST